MVKTPNGFANGYWVKNDVLMGAGRGLTDGDLVKSFRDSDIFTNYLVKEEIMRRAATPPP